MKKKILIIEDTPETLDILKWRAERNEFECLLDETGATRQEKVDGEKPDAVLLDMNLPLMGGFGILREFKNREDLADIPVFVLSGIYDEEVKVEAQALGAIDYFGKDEDIDKIFKKVRSFISHHPSNPEASR